MQIWSLRNQNFTLQELWSNQIIQNNNNNTKQKKKNFSIFSVIEVAKIILNAEKQLSFLKILLLHFLG